ncbi:Histone-lysine N-methyltransferase, H3 lysine-79 specific [Candida viswanathii]|uniref:Histone-lysine N-methyltransferase, H3 lysine-79 specific n=1 Tax=Candida viswanathii TaxID=5486 RepID=A0A367XVM0_9ASCO|nr:Histone-lysine N-methyltransferase, H3 lysine-79 specific [Candida viswanathii]
MATPTEEEGIKSKELHIQADKGTPDSTIPAHAHLHTPDMSDYSCDESKLSSEADETQEDTPVWTEELDETLKELVSQPITFSHVLTRFPEFDWEFIGTKIVESKINRASWKKKLLAYDLLFKKQGVFELENRDHLFDAFDMLKSHDWDDGEIEQFVCCFYEDLTTARVQAGLPNKSLKDVTKVLNQVQPRVFWTPAEEQLVRENLDDMDGLSKGLFYRTENAIRKKTIIFRKTKRPDTGLQKYASSPMTFSEILKMFPNQDWRELSRKLTSKAKDSNWSKKIGCYCLLYHFEEYGTSKVGAELLEVIGQARTEFQAFSKGIFKAFSLNSFGKCSRSLFEKLYSLFLYDLTKETCKELVPRDIVAHMKNFVSAFDPRCQNLSPGEIDFLEKNTSMDLNELMQNLPCRTKDGISRALESLLNPEPEADPLLDELVEHDLTLETIKAYFPKDEFQDILNEIRIHPKFNADTFTKGETKLMNDLALKNTPVDKCIQAFPARDEEFLRRMYHESKYITGRKKKFTSPEERLLYEARWTVSSMGNTTTSNRDKRAQKRSADFEEIAKLEEKFAVKRSKKLKPELSEKELALRRERQEKRRLEKEKAAEEKQKKIQLQRLQKQEREPKPKKQTESMELKMLLEAAEYFQSTVGDRKTVREGEKRRKVKAEYYEPEAAPSHAPVKLKTTHRQAMKNNLKKVMQLKAKEEEAKLKKKEKPQSKRSKSRRALDDYTIAELETHYEIKEETPVPDDTPSKYDPPDILADSYVELKGRHLFVSEFYDENPVVPKLEFVNISQQERDNSHDKSMSPGKAVMTANDDKILFDDNLALELVIAHVRSYRDMPVGFPPRFIPDTKEINPLNIVRIRFLLYPEHCELFILGSPKSNELDPAQEIAKVFMIHYSLYFSHSEELKNIIIEDYCKKLETSIDNSDFAEFMSVIDNWNALMLHLSPNTESCQRIVESGADINEAPKQGLHDIETKPPTSSDLKIHKFYQEILYETVSPSYQEVQNTLGESSDTLAADATSPSTAEVEVPTNVSKDSKVVKPDNYNADFFRRLREKTEISRYAMQQLLLRVYSRIVSTDSKKLRSYKAFTAEVYGELLPSFTSEVLEKVNLSPGQRFYDLGSGVGNTTFQAALEFGAAPSGGCEIMDHASHLTKLQTGLLQKHLAVLGLTPLNLNFELHASFVNNERVTRSCLDCDVLIINNYLFDGALNAEVGRMLVGLQPGTKIISLRNFISPRYRATGDTVFDYLRVEKHEMSDVMSVSWTANKVPYYISTVQETILSEYLRDDGSVHGGASSSDRSSSKSVSPLAVDFSESREDALMMTPPTDSETQKE